MPTVPYMTITGIKRNTCQHKSGPETNIKKKHYFESASTTIHNVENKLHNPNANNCRELRRAMHPKSATQAQQNIEVRRCRVKRSQNEDCDVSMCGEARAFREACGIAMRNRCIWCFGASLEAQKQMEQSNNHKLSKKRITDAKRILDSSVITASHCLGTSTTCNR